MRSRATIGVIAALAASVTLAVVAAAPATATTTCTWGGTPAAPTGIYTITPGLLLTPSTEPLDFWATGELAGDPRCVGELTFTGQIDTGGTCAYFTGGGKAKGLPGVATFRGGGPGPIAASFLYDKKGNVVGYEQPVVQQLEGDPQNCDPPEGITHGHFSSVIELF
jgi:hypothetical protein